jgi:hypothetical protein
MALNKVLAHLNMKGGIDQKEDARLVIPSKMLDVRDAVFDGGTNSGGEGTFVTRGGLSTQALTALTSDTATPASPVRLFTNEGSPVVENFYGAAAVVKDVGVRRVEPYGVAGLYPKTFVRAGMTSKAVSGSIPRFPASYSSDGPKAANEWDCARNSTAGRTCFAWTVPTDDLNEGIGYGRLSLYYNITDDASGAVVCQGEIAATNDVITHPRVVYCSSSNKFLLYFVKYDEAGTQFLVRVITLSGSGAVTVSAASTVYTSTDFSPNYIDAAGYEPVFDCVVDGSSVFFAVRSSTTTFEYKLLSGTDGYTASGSRSYTVSAGTIAGMAVVVTTGTYKYIVTWTRSDYDGQIRAAGWDSGSFFGAEAVLLSGYNTGTVLAGRPCAYYYEGTIGGFDNQLVVVCDGSRAGSFNTTYTFNVVVCDADLSPVNISWQQTNWSWLIAGRLAVDANNRLYLPFMQVLKEAEPTFYLALIHDVIVAGITDPCIVARVDWGECGYPVADSWRQQARVPSCISNTTDNVITFGYPKYVPDLQLDVQPTLLMRADVRFNDKLGQSEVNGLTYLAGACPHIYDGKHIVEEGFHHNPIIIAATTSSIDAAEILGLPTGTYYVTVTMGWQDSKGNWHESGPAAPVALTTTEFTYPAFSPATGVASGTAGVGTTSTLVVKPTATADWTASNLVGKYLKVTGGGGYVGGGDMLRLIEANGVTTLSVSALAGMNSTTTFELVSRTGSPNIDLDVQFPKTWKPGAKKLYYRTADGASLGPFYRAHDKSGATITSDATLVEGEQLYTTPGVEGQALYHDPMPSCRHIEQHQGRLFLSGCEDGYTVFYSNQTYEGRGVEFSTLLQKRTDYEFGRIVATQSQDGKLVVLGERKLGVLLGQGPTDTGDQDGYSDIEVVVHNEGAKWAAPKSVCTSNEGVWFQSATGGLRLLGRNNALARTQDGRFVGSEVDAQLGTTYIANAVIGDNKNQIRFYHSGGGVLVFDTMWNQWSRFSNHTHVDACYADGRFYHITSTPMLLYYNESAHTDDGTVAVEMYLLTPWLSLAGIQGFQRVYKAMFLGGPVDASSDTQVVTLNIGYNFEAATATTLATDDVTTSASGLTQFEHPLAVQKCESAQLALYVKSKANASRFRLSDIALQVGLKQGRFKLPATRRF